MRYITTFLVAGILAGAQEIKPPAITPLIDAWTKEPDGFKGVKFGSTEAQARDILHFRDCYGGPKVQRQCTILISAETFSISAILTFSMEGTLVMISGDFPSERFSRIQEMFLDLYGPAHKSDTSTIQNRLGGRFDQIDLKWKGDSAIVMLSRFGSTVTKGQFTILTAAYAEEITKPKTNVLK